MHPVFDRSPRPHLAATVCALVALALSTRTSPAQPAPSTTPAPSIAPRPSTTPAPSSAPAPSTAATPRAPAGPGARTSMSVALVAPLNTAPTTVTIPARPAPAAPIVTGPLRCTHGALHALVVSDWWRRMGPVCDRITAVLPHRVDAPAGVPDAMMQSVVAQCADGRSVRALCGLDAYRRTLLTARVEALAETLSPRVEVAQRLCGETDVAAAIAPSAPAGVRDEVRDAVAAVTGFCAQDDGAIPTARQSALVRLAREVAAAATRSNLTPEQPATTALWASLASGPGSDPFRQGLHDEGGSGSAARHDASHAESESASGGIGGVSALANPAGFVDIALRGLAELLQSRAQAEVEGFMLDQLRDVVCGGAARPWFEYTCAYLVAPDASLRVTVGSALRLAFRADVMAFPRRITARAPREGDTRQMLGTLWFRLLSGATESRTLVDLGDRFSDAGGHWTCRGDEPQLCAHARAAVEGTGLLLSLALRRDDLDALPPAVFHALVETVYDRQLSTDAWSEVDALRAALAEFEQAFAQSSQNVRTPTAQIARTTATLGGLRPLFARGVSVALFDDPGEPRVSLAEGLPEIYSAFARADLVEVAVQSQRAVTVVLPFTGLPPDVLRAMVLAAEVAQARNPEQIRAALESAVSPPGAWRLKRRRAMLSLTGLVGVSGGGDLLLASGLSDAGLVPSVGLVGAVGLDVSFPVRTSTLGVFVSVIDLGGLLSIPLAPTQATLRGSDGVQRPATLDVTGRISVEQVLSPGVYFRWGIGRSPFVFAAGASIVPFGRSVQEVRGSDATGAAYTSDASVLRFNALLGVDLTLLPF